MEEIYQITAALKHLSWGHEVTVVTDARFSGVSTGACIGHVGPEALAGGPLGKLRDGDLIEIVIDCRNLVGTVNFVGGPEKRLDPAAAAEVLAARPPREDLRPDPALPDDTRLWAALQGATFVPPVDKAGNPIIKKGPNGGVIDSKGREWTRDKAAERVSNGHWDVQLPNGKHLNVNGSDVPNEGEINHGK